MRDARGTYPADRSEEPPYLAWTAVRQNRTFEKVIIAAAAIAPLVGLLSANAYAPLILIVAVMALASRSRRQILDAAPTWLGVAFLLLAVLGFASVLWSITPAHSAQKVLQLLPLLAAGYVLVGAASNLPADVRHQVGRWLALGTVAAIALVFVETVTGGILNHLLTGMTLHAPDAMARYKRGVVVVGLLALPAAYWTWQTGRGFAAAGILAGALASAFVVQSGTTVLALVVGAVLIAAAIYRPQLVRKGFAVALAMLVLGAPLLRLAPAEVPPSLLGEIRTGGMYRLSSAAHRWVIWQFAAEKIAERPLLGWGLDTSRAIPGGHAEVQGYSERMPLHPHNAVLQVWLELGVIGALIGAFLVSWPVVRVGRVIAPGPGAAVALGIVAATVVVALLGFGIWQSWWIGAIALVAMASIAILPPRSGPA